MSSLRTMQNLKPVNAFWAGYSGMPICAALETRQSRTHETFRPGPGGVKNIAI